MAIKRSNGQTDRKKFSMDIASNLATAEDRGRAEGIDVGFAKGFANGLAKGKAEGKAEALADGKAEGIAENKVEIARNALKMGLSIDDIVKLTSLTREEVENLS